jgi:NADPH2:quinone reductase
VIGLTEFGGPEVLRVIELPDPTPGSGEVRIRLHAASVNPTDTMLRSGATNARFDDRPRAMLDGSGHRGLSLNLLESP